MKIEEDKKAHFLLMMWGTFLAAAMSMNAWIAVSLALAIGISKEVFDYYTGGVASWGDMAANLLGIFVGITVFIVSMKIAGAWTNND
jgi:VanZ family protein